MEINKVYLGDCKEVMKQFPDNTFDSIVTDPPYELGFMGKGRDKTGIANDIEMRKECLRILKPGGYLLNFSGARTYHRMACAIEDAGFEIRNMIERVYGSGFPKSLNIGKKIGGEREGRGTDLKPAHEPICMARKPLSEKTVVDNVLKWGTGGINIDESRVGNDKIKTNGKGNMDGNTLIVPLGRFPANLIHDGSDEVKECFPFTKSGEVRRTTNNFKGSNNINIGGGLLSPENSYGDSGNASRFFKECKFTEEDFKSILYYSKASKSERNMGCDNLEDKCCVKVNAPRINEEEKTKPRKNNHPTVKPLALMEYLVKMVTRPGGLVLDPFAGSGTTLIACKRNGYNYVGIEITEEYIPIIEARLSAVNNISLF